MDGECFPRCIFPSTPPAAAAAAVSLDASASFENNDTSKKSELLQYRRVPARRTYLVGSKRKWSTSYSCFPTRTDRQIEIDR